MIVNNITQANYEAKSRELSQFLLPEHFHYFAQYLVVKRVSVEYNFQQTYIDLLDKLRNPKLDKLVLANTYNSIDV